MIPNLRWPFCAALLLAAGPAPAPAQVMPGAVEGELLRRAQQQDDLLLRQRQFEQANRPGLGPGERADIERRQALESERLRILGEEQQRRIPLRPAYPALPPPPLPDDAPYRAEQFGRERESVVGTPAPR